MTNKAGKRNAALAAALLVAGYVLGWKYPVAFHGAATQAAEAGSRQVPIMAQEAAAPPTADKRVVVAAVQCPSAFGDPTANRSRLCGLVREAAGHGAKIIVLPEAAISGYVSQDQHVIWHKEGKPLEDCFEGCSPELVAEFVPGESTRQFGALAKELGVYVTVPFVERAASSEECDNDQFFNTVCLVSPKGEIVAHYRKLHPYPPDEQSWATGGDLGIQTCETEYGRVGLAICYDIHFALDDYRNSGVWALLYSSCWTWGEHPADWFWHELPRRISAFHHYFVGANWSVDAPQPWRGYGFSEIIDPDGRILACAHSVYGSEIVYAELETSPPGRLPDPAKL